MAAQRVGSIPFGERNRGTPFNASGVAQVAPGRFVFVDNQDPSALFELVLDADGRQADPIVRRPLTGLPDGALSDPEGLARIDVDGEVLVIITSSLGRTKKSVHDGLVRVQYTEQGPLAAEAVTGFRDWLLAAYPALAGAAAQRLDDGGLNIEGLVWDPHRRALLFGLRAPATAEAVPVLPVLLDPAGPWTAAALRADPMLSLDSAKVEGVQGIRGMTYDAGRGEFLVLLGGSVRRRDGVFALCSWRGDDGSTVLLDARFDKDMKPEGITVIDGSDPRQALVVDDGGGYAVVTV